MLLATLGVIALAVWAGWIVGPVLSVIAACLPSRPATVVAEAGK
jgi:hypothetical protein